MSEITKKSEDLASLITKKLITTGAIFIGIFTLKIAYDIFTLIQTDSEAEEISSDSDTTSKNSFSSFSTPEKKNQKKPKKSILKEKSDDEKNFFSGDKNEKSGKEFGIGDIGDGEKSSGRKNAGFRKLMQKKKKLLDKENVQVIKICFTGGPCAGKTTAITTVGNTLRDKGFTVVCVPEAATLIFSSGGILDMETYDHYQAIQFQKALMSLQINLEDDFVDLSKIKQEKTVFVLCDRGLMDGSAYISQEQWDVLLDEMGLDYIDCLQQYDIVIHMTTAADGAKEHYQTMNNNARSEDFKAAIDLDRKLQKAWSGHPSNYIVDNNVKNFNEKIKKAENLILKTLGMKPSTGTHKKFLIRNPNGKFFKFLVKEYLAEVFTLSDTFLGSMEEKVSYVRKRVQNGRNTFLKGTKKYIEGGDRISTKRNILWKEYVALKNVQKDCNSSITRNRIICTYVGTNIIVDEIMVKDIPYCQIIVQVSKTVDKEATVNLPEIIRKNIIKEISNDPMFRLEEMAKRDYILPEDAEREITDMETYQKIMKASL